MNCRHLKKSIGCIQTAFGNEPEFACAHRRHKKTTIAGCVTCPDYLTNRPLKAPPAPKQGCRHPTGVIVDRYDRDCNLADLYKGASAFLVLGGPSAKTMPLELLGRRGVLILSVNNCPAVLPPEIRPHVWLHTDPARKFHDSIWRDPGVLKIVPVRDWKLGRGGKSCLRTRDPETDKLIDLPGVCGKDMPGVLGFHRNTSFDPENWLYEPKVNRGNDEETATGIKKGKNGKADQKLGEPNGWPKTINTMFAALRLAFYLGIKRLYLVGADFHMEPDQPYGFDQDKGCGGIRGNNNAYAAMCVMFDGLLPYFEQAGFEVINCTPDSGLYSFDFVPFEEAIAAATEGFEQEMNCNGWYTPEPKPEVKDDEKDKSDQRGGRRKSRRAKREAVT